ncbi:DUF4350 domain-containing protein [Chamaesiphon sp. VAR_48_metabat_135_sub]|uniref:DUF4350 domain-containing protein n=1 Tax=Chamaesiphon sp. VAR_48_metabat_135_sub TaxID=2964699 RepID=UPI00286C05DA|nr:DUF4350 domain-containing protein [Chamaesiphon sp. VAR_48_metabat_135_sub]
MADFKKLLKQYWQLGLVAAIAIVLLTIVSATSGDGRQTGSSYSIAANGYNAWYQMMFDRGINIQRWQKSFPQLTKTFADRESITLLQINPKLERFDLTNLQKAWVSQGNTIVILGVTAPAWDIPFRTELESPQGNVKIETTRRFRTNFIKNELSNDTFSTAILNDKFGSIITQFKLEKGQIIIATTPNLAANAYQDFRPNYELLAKLVTKDRQQILVDEYIHGYIDRTRQLAIDPKTGKILPEEQTDNVGDAFGYLASTPLIIVFLNLLLGILVLVWQQNRRFGKIIIPKLPELDNSEAYIQALGGVLRQANSSDFVLQNIGRAEQLSWQQKLGLGKERLVETQILISAWEDRMKSPTDDLRFVLQLMAGERRLTPAELTIWLTKIHKIDRQLKIIN